MTTATQPAQGAVCAETGAARAARAVMRARRVRGNAQGVTGTSYTSGLEAPPPWNGRIIQDLVMDTLRPPAAGQMRVG